METVMNTIRVLSILGAIALATAAYAQQLGNSSDAVQEQNDAISLARQNAADAAEAAQSAQALRASIAAKSTADQALSAAHTADAEAKTAEARADRTFEGSVRK